MSTLADRQLAAWERIAKSWDLRHDDRVLRCAECGNGVMLITDSHGDLYQYSYEQWLALVVLHLRNHHLDLDPDT